MPILLPITLNRDADVRLNIGISCSLTTLYHLIHYDLYTTYLSFTPFQFLLTAILHLYDSNKPITIDITTNYPTLSQKITPIHTPSRHHSITTDLTIWDRISHNIRPNNPALLAYTHVLVTVLNHIRKKYSYSHPTKHTTHIHHIIISHKLIHLHYMRNTLHTLYHIYFSKLIIYHYLYLAYQP